MTRLINCHIEAENSEYLFYAKNTAIIPSIKAGVYYQLRGIYQINHEGQKAIDAYEKAVKIAGHEDKLEKAMICIVYFAMRLTALPSATRRVPLRVVRQDLSCTFMQPISPL